MPFTDQTAWITGASSGVGEALALALAARGCRLILSARSADALASVADACAARGPRPLVLPLDVTDAAARTAAYARLKAEAGPLDILFNNAGVAQRASVVDTPLEVVRAIMELNFFAPAALAKLVVPDMAARGAGRIVVTSSIGGKFGAPMRSTYAASKHALHGWFEALRVEQPALDIQFLLIGSVRTDIVKHALTADGTAFGETDAGHAHGLPPAEFAALALAGLERGDHEIFVGSDREKRLVDLKRADPDALTAELAGLYLAPK